jgi:hypothetical protein
MKPISVDNLTQKKRRELTAAAQKLRPDAKFRSEFAQLMQRRRELRQNHSPSLTLGGGEASPARPGVDSSSQLLGSHFFHERKKR